MLKDFENVIYFSYSCETVDTISTDIARRAPSLCDSSTSCADVVNYLSKDAHFSYPIFVSDIAIFVLQRDVKLQLSN